jgi:hypothetical protein
MPRPKEAARHIPAACQATGRHETAQTAEPSDWKRFKRTQPASPNGANAPDTTEKSARHRKKTLLLVTVTVT